jgi:hypothetical protein
MLASVTRESNGLKKARSFELDQLNPTKVVQSD